MQWKALGWVELGIILWLVAEIGNSLGQLTLGLWAVRFPDNDLHLHLRPLVLVVGHSNNNYWVPYNSC